MKTTEHGSQLKTGSLDSFMIHLLVELAAGLIF
jgi:hypothetical protein